LSLSHQGKYADAERIQREVLGAQKRVLGAEHPSTLSSANNLAASLSNQGKYADAEPIQREVHEVRKRLLGAEHPKTLSTANNLAESLSNQGKCAEAEVIQREVHEVQKRVLGAEHPDTLTTENNLAASLARQGEYVEAEQMLHAALASLQRVLGPTHPDTLQTACSLEHLQARIRATPPTNASAARRHSRARAATRRQARAQRQACARGVVRRAHRPVCRFAGRWEGAVAQGRVRGSGRVRLGGMRVGGGEQRVRSMPGGAVLLARVPAHGLEGAQAGVRGTAMSVGASEAAMNIP
jgi:tetratricopeptide (TPR) repeat protein